MKVEKVNVLVETKRTVKIGDHYKSFALHYGATARLEKGETIDNAIPALDAKIRDLLGQADGVRKTKLIIIGGKR
jgi:hypothetical protein